MEVVLPCMHAFCEACITDWLKKQPECPLCRQNIKTKLNVLSRRSSEASNGGDTSFFELIDTDGKDDVIPDLENRVEVLINTAIGFLINMKEYNVKQKMKENPHMKVNLETYMYKVLNEEQIKYLLNNGITFKP